jgi:ADP-ribosyl-[dinitrogen reductase] hydrolase
MKDTLVSNIRTSLSHPLRVDTISVPRGSGQIGMTLCPGRRDHHSIDGEWARDLDLDLDVIAEWKPDAILTLLEPHEFRELGIPGFAEAVLGRGLTWKNLPIKDGGIPSASFERQWETSGAALRALLQRRGRVLIHCRAGLGRTGTIAARLLIELGLDPKAAINAVRAARPRAIERGPQQNYVLRCRSVRDNDLSPIEDRALGCLLGLAVGDALGTTLEFRRRDSYAPLTDMIGGGPFSLKAGEWTDDTSMAICLAESLIAYPDLDEKDLMDRFVRWSDHGENSVNGRCFDIGLTTRRALDRFLRTKNPIAGSTSPDSAGNGSLMRLAPVVLRWLGNSNAAMMAARRQSATTHAAPSAVEGCAYFVCVLIDAMTTGSKTVALAPRKVEQADVGEVALGSWDRDRRYIRSTGYVIDTLEAALWSVARASSFEEALLLAANLGEDADTVAAVTGQLAGAIWGKSSIPARWLDLLAERERIELLGRRLIEIGSARGSLQS